MEKEQESGPSATTSAAVERVAATALASRTMFGGIEQLSDEQFDARLAMLKTGIARVKQIMRVAMTGGTHYGVPGLKGKAENEAAAKAGRVGLYKAGCEMLWSMLGHAPGEPTIAITYGDPKNEASPAINVNVSAPIHLADQAGVVLATGVGNCNSMEVKYRWRDALPKCPACGREAVFRSKYSKDGKPPGFYCSDKRGGCGAQFAADDPAITAQAVGRTANPELFDLLNTLVKMATKRAFTDATIRAARASDLFSPDLEDMPKADRDRVESETRSRMKDLGVAETEWDEAAKRGAAAESGERRADARALPPCPACGKALMRSKYPGKGDRAGQFGLYCNANHGGCGATVWDDDPRLAPKPAAAPPAAASVADVPANDAQRAELYDLVRELYFAESLVDANRVVSSMHETGNPKACGMTMDTITSVVADDLIRQLWVVKERKAGAA